MHYTFLVQQSYVFADAIFITALSLSHTRVRATHHATQANVKHGGAKWFHKLFFYIPCQKVHSVLHMNPLSLLESTWLGLL